MSEAGEFEDEDEIDKTKLQLQLPRVFIGGKYIGGAEEVKQLHETGELKKFVERLPAVTGGVCALCVPTTERKRISVHNFIRKLYMRNKKYQDLGCRIRTVKVDANRAYRTSLRYGTKKVVSFQRACEVKSVGSKLMNECTIVDKERGFSRFMISVCL
uniref:Putative thioredoxin-like fold protein n=1 Tax=Helianthus annuus TaxID=4232 RepID=A0A251U7U4_HELAN